MAVLAAGFDAVVNERANKMTWPRGQMRYNLATIAELRTFEPLHYEIDLDGEQRSCEAMLVAVGNGPSFGGGLRIAEGAILDDGLLDVVVIGPMSKPELIRTYPKLFRGTHVTTDVLPPPGTRVTVACPGHRGLRRRRGYGALPLTIECVPQALAGAGRRTYLRVTSPRRSASTLDDFQVEACQALEAGHGVLVAAPTGAGKTVVGEFAVQLAMSRPQVLLHDADQGTLEPEVRTTSCTATAPSTSASSPVTTASTARRRWS